MGDGVTGTRNARAPTLLIEVVSDPKTDRIRKRELYAKAGVPGYWVVDPDANRVRFTVSLEGRYGEPGIFEVGETLLTPHLPGLQIDLTDLFGR